MAYLSKKHYDVILIFSTSLLGAYSIIRGLSLFIPGSFPNETDILSQIADGSIETSFYLYISGFIVISALGMVY